MPVPFGFSLGDFIAVADLASKISKALSEVRGSQAEYKDLVELLDSLNNSLRFVHNFLISSSSTAGFPPPDVALLNGLRYQLDKCRDLMTSFLEESRKFTESFIRAGTSNVSPEKKKWGIPNWKFRQDCMIKELRKIQWSMYNAEDARNLEHRLKSHVNAFEIILIAISLQSQVRTQRAIDENLAISRRTEQTLSDLCEHVKVITSGQLPNALGYSWQGSTGLEHGVISLEDASGRFVDLPTILCRNFDSFHDTLEIMFRKRPGHKIVAAGDYEIEGAEGKLVTASEWQNHILPGVRIAMNILIRQSHPKKFDELSSRKCPRCSALAPESAVRNGSIGCGDCNLIFRLTDSERVADLSEDDATDRPSPGSATPSAVLNKEEEEVFQRIHYIREFLMPQPSSRSTELQAQIDALTVRLNNIMDDSYVRDIIARENTNFDILFREGGGSHLAAA
ncbi:hypothetical protein BDD12DRAFT_875385 [Trichophaea hybrida]|nr:hypothetical protein BDD12DRAFT_875385 [Trichophaea hybrida]